MPICPTCQSKVPGTIANIRTGRKFCEFCAEVVCPTYNKHAVLSVEEAAWLKAQGIDPNDGLCVSPEIAEQHRVLSCGATTHNQPFAVS
jgi:hypothetical protein